MQTLGVSDDPSVTLLAKKVKKFKDDSEVLQEDLRAHEKDAVSVLSGLQERTKKLDGENLQCQRQLEEATKVACNRIQFLCSNKRH